MFISTKTNHYEMFRQKDYKSLINTSIGPYTRRRVSLDSMQCLWRFCLLPLRAAFTADTCCKGIIAYKKLRLRLLNGRSLNCYTSNGCLFCALATYCCRNLALT